jgi:hypothetical protein
VDDVVQHIADHLAGDQPPALTVLPGLTPEKVGGFYEAAAAFFTRAPWRHVGYESAIRVDCAAFQEGPWYAVLMGQSGLTMGLALYEDLALLRRLWTGDLSDEENARLTVATTLTYGDETSVAPAEVDAAEKHGWPVARPDAYPSVFRKERGLTMRSPLAWELELMEACLRAIPDFVERHPQDDTTREEVTVRVGAGTLTLGLAWVPEETPA